MKVAVVQESPVFFNKLKTLQKVKEITITYAKQNCKLIVFPESFIPGYPRGFDFGAKVGSRTLEGKKLFAQYRNESVDVNSDDISFLEELSSKHDIYIVIGVTEKNNLNGN